MLIKNVLVATDFGEASDAALASGRLIARACDATLHVLHVAHNVYMHGAGGAACLAVFRCDGSGVSESGADLPARQAVTTADADAVAATIVGYATGMGIDMIVLGNPSADDCLADPAVNSVAHRVARTAPCSVLTVAGSNRVSVPDVWSAAGHA